MDNEIPLLSKLFHNLDLTEIGKTFKNRQASKDLTEIGKTFKNRQASKDLTEIGKICNNNTSDYHLTEISNTTSNNDNNTIITKPNTQKLYKRMGNNQLGRVRSVVRISRRSSEPQTVGSKPIGPVTIMALLRGVPRK